MSDQNGCSTKDGCPTFGASLFLRLRWDIHIYSFLWPFTLRVVLLPQGLRTCSSTSSMDRARKSLQIHE